MNNTEDINKKSLMCSYEPDDVILREGENSDVMYKVLSGSVVVYMRYGEEDEHVVGVYSKSQCFGEWNMLTGQPSVYTFVAFEKTMLMQINRNSLEDFIRNYPQNALDIMQNMAQSTVMMRTNVDLLLDELYEKDIQNKQRTEELRKRMQYSLISGLGEWPEAFPTPRPNSKRLV